MSVQVYERASTSFAAGLAKRGHHIVYRANSLVAGVAYAVLGRHQVIGTED